MARTTRQTVIFGVEDWRRIYETFREADFQSYDFETLRKSFVDYLRQFYPETFNDYIESSEFIALLDVIAFMGQALSFRNDLNTRENYIDTAERRDSVVKLANLVGYTPKRNTAAQGFLKVFNVQTTENVLDFNGINLANITVNWNDPTNLNWQEQFVAIINAALVDSQKIGRPGNRQTILDVPTDEYSINIVPGFLPVVGYNATIDGIQMPFEAVSSTSVGNDYIYEPSPQANAKFNVLYKNDQLGFESFNTGFFFFFKQGVLLNQDFNLPEQIANQTVEINIEGVNNLDRWLFELSNNGNVQNEWTFVDNVFAGAVEQIDPEQRKLFSVTSRVNDQITLIFGDGVFSAIPVGLFRCYVRASNGLRYIINPEEMQGVVIPLTYISRTGQTETITFTCGITQPVSNAQQRESLNEIRQRAPARYYTQNRMVNGEDYNNFPFTLYNSIIKSKAVNRASIGTSRWLDLVDNTGKYSSTNSFGSDGALWEDLALPTFSFTWVNQNDIANVLNNQVDPRLLEDTFTQFYYAYFTRPSLTSLDIVWNQSTTLVNETSGYFENSDGTPIPVGTASGTNTKYITTGSLVRFAAPAGRYFDINNRLQNGSPSADGEKAVIWASVLNVVGDGTNEGQGNLNDGSGPVTLNNFVPSDAIPTQVIPVLVTTLPPAIIANITDQIILYRNFGLGYNNLTATWYVITSTNLDVDAEFSLANAQSTAGTNSDASWLFQFITDGDNYTVSSRSLVYSFGSVLQTRFFFETGQNIYDTRTGTTIRDFIKVLRSNSQPDSNVALPNDYFLRIIDQPILSDGLVDDFQVTVSFEDSDADGIADDPDFFENIVAPSTDSTQKTVFFEKTIDFDNLERYLLVDYARVYRSLPTLDSIELVKTEFDIGQIFYAYSQVNIDGSVGAFYQLGIVNDQRQLVDVTASWTVKTGRQNIYYQYRHNTPLTNRIDPGTSNIVDLYVVTQQYYIAYQNWIRDTTDSVPEPIRPTINELSTEYQGLADYKMISDNIVVNSVVFKPLFGAKAQPELRATIKVIRAANSNASDSEIKNLVITNLNNYFTIDKWNFGDTFYFSELAAYVHANMGGIVSSVVIVPLDRNKSFGDLYEIRSAPNEIFVNAATVSNIEVIAALTSSNIRTAPGSGVI